jgi:hypothetical protein
MIDVRGNEKNMSLEDCRGLSQDERNILVQIFRELIPGQPDSGSCSSGMRESRREPMKKSA